jgi:hypothetical protein
MAPSPVPPSSDQAHWRRIVEDCFRSEAGASAPIPEEAVDLEETGILDSMAWVGFRRCRSWRAPHATPRQLRQRA